MGGESFHYKFGNKNNWRRWLWNRLRDRVDWDLDGGVVLYLAGQYDLDRNVAIAKGFREHNLLAIEKNHSVAQSIRRNRTLVIQEEAETVLMSWPKHRPVQAVVLDMCCGLEDRIIRLSRSLNGPSFKKWAFDQYKGEAAVDTCKRKISAILAHRTMRMQAV